MAIARSVALRNAEMNISINRNAAVELRITLEAEGTDHKNRIVQALNDAGYRPKLVKSKGTYSD